MTATEALDVANGLQPQSLEGGALPAYVPQRRWFASKGEVLAGVRVAYAVPLPGAPDVLLAEIAATLPGRTEHYVLPLGLAWETVAEPLVRQLALAAISDGHRDGVLTDAFALDAFAVAVLEWLRDGTPIALPGGAELRAQATARFTDLAVTTPASIRRLSAEQSNSSLIIGNAVVLKLVRRVTAGVHPEAEMTRVLTERGFANCAPMLAEMVRRDADGTPNTLMLAQGFVPNQGDAWGWTMQVMARADADALATTGAFAAAMGRRLAEMHAVLAEPTDDADFAPATADDVVLQGWASGALAQFSASVDILRARPDGSGDADAVLRHASNVADAVRRRAAAAIGALCTRVHGDFHLGQVLVVDGDACIIDFEGEPARTLAQRREKSSPVRDVAGLLRSFEYAAASLPADTPRDLVERFRIDSATRFLDAYRWVLARAPRPWVTPASEAALLDLFLLEKAAYEVRYEASNRPTWLAIPLRGLADIVARMVAQETI